MKYFLESFTHKIQNKPKYKGKKISVQKDASNIGTHTLCLILLNDHIMFLAHSHENISITKDVLEMISNAPRLRINMQNLSSFHV